MTGTIRSQFATEFTARLLGIAASAVLFVVLARWLEPGAYGLLFLAIAIFEAARIGGELGIAKSAARYVSSFRETDPGQVPHVLRVGLAFNLVSLALVSVGLVAFDDEIATLIGEPTLAELLVFGGAFVLFAGLTTYVRTVLQGLQAIEWSAFVNAFRDVSRLFLVLLLVALGFGVVGALVGYVLSFLLTAAIGFSILYTKRYRRFDASPVREPGLSRRILEYNVPITFTRSSNVLHKRVDVLLIGFFLNPVAVGYYTIAKQIVGFVETPAAALGFTVSPRYGELKSTDELSAAARLYETTLVHTLLLYLPAAAGIVLVADPAVRYVFGAAYLGAVPVLQVLSAFVLLQAVTQITSDGLDYIGRARTRAVIKAVTAVANAGLNVLLIPTMGVVGAAVATVLTYSFYASANLVIVHAEFGLRPGYLLRRTAHVGLITVAMSAIVLHSSTYVTGFASLLLVVSLGVLVWFGLSVFTGFLDPRRIVAPLT